MKTGLIIPAYHVHQSIHDVLSKSLLYIPTRRICLVDDGSADTTADAARKTGVVVIQHETNRGKGEALKTGFRWALENRLDAIITMDGDGQHAPEKIPDFIERMAQSDADLVIGSRRFRIGEMPLDRVFSNRLSSAVASFIAGSRIRDSQSGFRMIKTSVLEEISLMTSRFETETELLVKAVRRGFTVAYTPIPARYGDADSHIRRWDDTVRFTRLIFQLMKERKQKRRGTHA